MSIARFNKFKRVPEKDADTVRHATLIARELNKVSVFCNTNDFIESDDRDAITLTPNSATTTIENEKITGNSLLIMSPRTASAAAENWHYLPQTGIITITHANSAVADRTFRYQIQ